MVYHAEPKKLFAVRGATLRQYVANWTAFRDTDLGNLKFDGAHNFSTFVRSKHCLLKNTLKYERAELGIAAVIGFSWLARKGSGGLFVDVGANCGAFSMMMATIGHDCMAIDPCCQQVMRYPNPNHVRQRAAFGPIVRAILVDCAALESHRLPTCVDDLQLGRARNGFTKQVTVVAGGISDRAGAITVPVGICSPYFHLNAGAGTLATASVPSYSLDSLVAARGAGRGPRLVMLKIDTEGHEVRVLRSARTLLNRRAFPYILWELTPEKWHKSGIGIDEGVLSLAESIDAAGYSTFVGGERYGISYGMYRKICRDTPGICSSRPKYPETTAPDQRRLVAPFASAARPYVHLTRGASAFANASWSAFSRGLRISAGMNLLSVAVGHVDLVT